MSDASSIEDDLGSDNERKSVDKDFVVYSKGVKKETDEKKKGGAILKQQGKSLLILIYLIYISKYQNCDKVSKKILNK